MGQTAPKCDKKIEESHFKHEWWNFSRKMKKKRGNNSLFKLNSVTLRPTYAPHPARVVRRLRGDDALKGCIRQRHQNQSKNQKKHKMATNNSAQPLDIEVALTKSEKFINTYKKPLIIGFVALIAIVLAWFGGHRWL